MENNKTYLTKTYFLGHGHWSLYGGMSSRQKIKIITKVFLTLAETKRAVDSQVNVSLLFNGMAIGSCISGF